MQCLAVMYTVFNIAFSEYLAFMAFPLHVREVQGSVTMIEMVSFVVQLCALVVVCVDHLNWLAVAMACLLVVLFDG